MDAFYIVFAVIQFTVIDRLNTVWVDKKENV